MTMIISFKTEASCASDQYTTVCMFLPPTSSNAAAAAATPNLCMHSDFHLLALYRDKLSLA